MHFMRFGPQQRNQLHHKRFYKQNHIIMKKTTFYEAPETELILVNYEEAFLNGTTGGYTEGGGGSYGDDDTNDNGEY